MSLLLLFAYTNSSVSVPISELIQTAPLTGVGYAIQRPATSGEWRFGLELADPQAGTEIVWHDITRFYAGDVYQRGADEYLGRYRAAVAQVQLQTDNDDLAPWGQDTSALFGVDVPLDAGLLMRATMFRVDAAVTVEWEPLWTGRVETWGDASATRGQIRTHVVTVTDTIADLANLPTTVLESAISYETFLNSNAGWLFGFDVYGDQELVMAFDSNPVNAINRMDQGADPFGVVWRSRRDGRLIIYPAPWDTTNVDRWSNPLLDVYPDGLVFSFSPDFTDIEYIADDAEQQFGIQRTALGVQNSFLVTTPSDVFAEDNPLSIAKYGVRPFTATWAGSAVEQVVLDLLDSRAFASAQALPLRTTLDHEGFWSALAIVDHLDPVTVIHATTDDGLVVTAPGTIRNVTEERTVRGEGSDGVMLLSWQSTVQVDVTSTTAAPALLPVENLRLIATNSPLLGGPSSAEFAWDNPVQPSVTPTEVQLRVLGRSLIWFSESYPGVGADGTLIGFLSAATTYTLQVRLIRRENGVITAFSASRSVTFTTPAIIVPVITPGEDGDDGTNVGIPPDEGCTTEWHIEENDGTGWSVFMSGDQDDLVIGDDGQYHLPADILNGDFDPDKIYRVCYRVDCGDGFGPWICGAPTTIPDSWTDPCVDPPALSTFPFNDPSLLVYVPKVCTGFEDADPDYLFQGMLIVEAVSGIAGVSGDALAGITQFLGAPDRHALQAIADPEWSDTPSGILAYGECPQVVGATGDKTWTVRVNLPNTDDCVLWEVAGVRLECAAVSGTTWRAVAVVYKVGGTTVTLPTATVLNVDTEYVITATSELATGNVKIYVDDIEDNSVGGTDDVATIAALPIWRVGAPPESWVTDCALWDALFVEPTTLETVIRGFGPTRYYTCESALPFPDLGSLDLDTTTAAGSYTEGGEVGDDGRLYLDMTGTTDIRAGFDQIGAFHSNDDQTLLVFLKPDAVTGADRFILQQGNGTLSRGWLVIDTDGRLTYVGTDNTLFVRYPTTINGAVAGSWNMYTFRQGGVVSEWRRNNVDISDSGFAGGVPSNSMNAFRLGGSGYSGGIAHVATFDVVLTTGQMTAIYNAAVADGWTI